MALVYMKNNFDFEKIIFNSAPLMIWLCIVKSFGHPELQNGLKLASISSQKMTGMNFQLASISVANHDSNRILPSSISLGILAITVFVGLPFSCKDLLTEMTITYRWVLFTMTRSFSIKNLLFPPDKDCWLKR